MSTAERRAEFALLRLIGASRRHVVRMLCWETLIVLLIGTITGTAIGCVALGGAARALSGSTSLHLDPLRYGLVLSGAIVVGFLATLAPAAIAVRSRPRRTS